MPRAMATPILSTRSGANRPESVSPDKSLAGAGFSHRGLDYPFGREGPAPGELACVAEGIAWTRSPVPGSLSHINLWLIDEADGFAIVDSGLAIDAARQAWETLFEGPLAGRRATRLIVTHFHPDHIGLAGWLTRRFERPLFMTRGEWLFARMLTTDVRDAPPPEAFVYWRMAGWDEESIASEAARGWGRFASVVSEVPSSYVRLRDGDEIILGGRAWRIVVGCGHSPEHACLWDVERKILIAGDQVLPRITSNVSLSMSEPEGDPLGDWLDSIDRLRELPRDLLVLPSHGEPFYGLHARLDALATGHHGRLDALEAHLSEPRRAVDCFRTLFGRKVGDDARGLATGEAMAHLRWLELRGRAVREMREGVAFFSRS